MENKKREKNSRIKKPFQLLGMMGVCCLLPIALITIMPYLQIRGNSNILSGVFYLICPIMMIIMMVMMSKDSSCGKGNCKETKK